MAGWAVLRRSCADGNSARRASLVKVDKDEWKNSVAAVAVDMQRTLKEQQKREEMMRVTEGKPLGWRDYHINEVMVAMEQDRLKQFNEEGDGGNVREVVMNGMRNKDALLYAPEEFRRDREVMLQAVRKDGQALAFASPDLLHDRDIVLNGCASRGLSLRLASEALRADREVVLAALTQDGCALTYAAEPLKADKDLVLVAVRQNGRALKFAAKALREDADVAKAAVLQTSMALAYVLDGPLKDMLFDDFEERTFKTKRPLRLLDTSQTRNAVHNFDAPYRDCTGKWHYPASESRRSSANK